MSCKLPNSFPCVFFESVESVNIFWSCFAKINSFLVESAGWGRIGFVGEAGHQQL
jgi:hypothetical protein